MAYNVAAEPPGAAAAFDDFFQMYDGHVRRIIRTGGTVSNNQAHQLVEAFERYLIAIEMPAEVRNPIVVGLHAKIDLEYP